MNLMSSYSSNRPKEFIINSSANVSSIHAVKVRNVTYFIVFGGFFLAIFYIWALVVNFLDIISVLKCSDGETGLTIYQKTFFFLNPVDCILFFVRLAVLIRLQEFDGTVTFSLICLVIIRIFLGLNSTGTLKINISLLKFAWFILLAQFFEFCHILYRSYWDWRAEINPESSNSDNDESTLTFDPDDSFNPSPNWRDPEVAVIEPRAEEYFPEQKVSFVPHKYRYQSN